MKSVTMDIRLCGCRAEQLRVAMMQWQNNTLSAAFHCWQDYVVTKNAHSTKVGKCGLCICTAHTSLSADMAKNPPPCCKSSVWLDVYLLTIFAGCTPLHLHCMASKFAQGPKKQAPTLFVYLVKQ